MLWIAGNNLRVFDLNSFYYQTPNYIHILAVVLELQSNMEHAETNI